ncbi:MAG: SRPBCC family protein [Gemmatimonadota bacterium]
MNGSPFSIGTVVLGSAAVLLLAVLGLGFLLPADWEADASTVVEAPAEEVFAFLDTPEGWRRWTAWPDSGLVRSGPERGAGAEISWDDPEFGSGSFQIVEAVPHERVAYAVAVGNGAMRTEGTLTLSEEPGGVEISWHESGDLGRNPLMGYWAFFMDRAQTAELERSLDRLVAVVSDLERSR